MSNEMKEGPDGANWRTLPEICMMLHMHHTGSSDVLSDEYYREGVDYLRRRTESWQPAMNGDRWLAFDAAVFNLCAATLADAMVYGDKFGPAEMVT
jgi:hypothetical protein